MVGQEGEDVRREIWRGTRMEGGREGKGLSRAGIGRREGLSGAGRGGKGRVKWGREGRKGKG